MEEICKKEECYGCASCEDVCPVNAISMQADEVGFLCPTIDDKKCIGCRKCVNVCPATSTKRIVFKQPNAVYAMKINDDTIRRKSRSGGAAYALSESVLNNAGVVYGATIDEKQHVFHIRINRVQDLYRLQGSKYTQSNLRNIWRPLQEDLKSFKEVVFIGTPCQCAAVKNRFGEEYEKNLLLIDLICHGVPSPKLWEDYVQLVQKKQGSSVVRAQFRDVNEPWHNHTEQFEFENGQSIKRNDYKKMFYEHIFFRLSCATCPYATDKRVSDITVGDYWGIEKNHPEFKDNIGVSAILVNTDKGNQAFIKAGDNMICISETLQDVKRMNAPLNHPTGMNRKRDFFIWIRKHFGMNGLLATSNLAWWIGEQKSRIKSRR